MKITLNGRVTAQIVDKMLQEQEDKKQKIIAFCKNKNISDLQYKDGELEFEYHLTEDSKKTEKPFANPKPKVETRAKGGDKSA